jgi:hypothetical protein
VNGGGGQMSSMGAWFSCGWEELGVAVAVMKGGRGVALFYRAGEGCWGGEGGVTAREGGWLQWPSKSAHHGGAERPDAAGLGGGAIGVGQRGVEERADKRGPCVSEGREKRHRERKA